MTKEFYAAVLPSEGLYCSVGISGGKIITAFHDDIEGLIFKGSVYVGANQNAYFALASFPDASGGRKAEFAKALRCFFVDLDCGYDEKINKETGKVVRADKPYPDQAAGAVALRAFIDKTKLPEPYIVNSGRGLHVYWPFDEDLDAAAWAPLARRFKYMCTVNGLKIDRTVTADAARVLRMPDTMNFKDAGYKTGIVSTGVISSLQTLKDLMPESPDAIDDTLVAARALGMDGITRMITGGEFPPSSFAKIVRRSIKGNGCAQIANAVENAAYLEEPLWRAALSIAWRCTDAEIAIHKLSRPHPDYNAEDTLKKAEGTKGPTTCSWYKENYGSICTGCQQTCTSPILLGRTVEAAEVVGDAYVVEQQLEPDNIEGKTPITVQVEIPAYPFPYFRGVNGGVFKRTKDKDGEPVEIEIYPYDLYLTCRFYDSTEHGDGEGEIVSVNLHTPHDGIRKFLAPVATILTREKMRDLLLKNGVVAINKELDNIMAYFASSVRNLQKMFAADKTRNQMGWTPDDTGFVVGELEYTSSSVNLAPASNATKQVVPYLVGSGSLSKWTEMVNFYNTEGMEAHALAVFFGFGSPLLRLLGGIEVRGATINLMSNKSGTGKTTAQMVANSIWGHPSNLLLKKDDTFASKIQWVGMMNSLAVTMDEITNIDDEALSELAYDIPQGRGKHRMEAQSNKLRMNIVSWMMFVITSSNSSMYDKLLRLKSTSDGELRRLLEFRINRPPAITKQQSDEVFATLNANYGVAGPVFIRYVLQNREKVLALLEKMKRKVDEDLKLDQSDRFYSVCLACAFVGGIIARDLGLHSIQVSRVYTYATDSVRDIKQNIIKQVTDTRHVAQETLMTYINENVSNTLIVNSIKRGETPQAPLNINGFRGPLRMRYEPDSRELWIPSSALRDFFVSRQVDFRQALSELTRLGIVKNEGTPIVKRLGAGALGSFEAAGVRSYCIDGAAMGIENDAFAVADAPDT